MYECERICKTLSKLVRNCTKLKETVRICKNAYDFVRVYKNMLEFVKIVKNYQESVRITTCTSSSKDSFTVFYIFGWVGGRTLIIKLI